jgi:hypothetical protein
VAIERRIAGLERRARRDRAFALGALAIVLATAQAPSAPSAVRPLTVGSANGASARLDARGLHVRDAGGKIRADAGFDNDGSPSADLYDATGELRQAAYLLKDAPLFGLFDAAGKRRSEMFLSSDNQNPEFLMHDAAGVERVGLFQGTKGWPEFALSGSDGKVRTYFETDDTSPFIVMNDGAGTMRLVLGGYTTGKIGADIRDASGNVLWSTP